MTIKHKTRGGLRPWLIAASALLLHGCDALSGDGAAGGVDREAMLAASGNTADWLSYGRTYDEQRFSPADQINAETVSDLGLAWFADMDTARGQEATPIVIDGTIYITTAWSKVKAYDAATGKLNWEYDPEVPGDTAVKAC
jgi:alcohol dehydrogenase (cytochrome c)/quinohemoprotein ethanol dehydrogenase